MASVWKLSLVLKGLNDRTIPKEYDLGEFDGVSLEVEFGEANNAAVQIVGALSAITEATIVKQTLSYVMVDDAGLAGGGDVTEYALLNVWTLDEDDPTAVDHIAQHYVPAPAIGIFEGTTGKDRDRVDRSDADLTQYVQQVSQHAFISDGETIQTALGVGGMDSGKRVVRKYSPKSL